MPDPRKILVAQTIYLGDLVLAFPLLNALREAYPSARVDLLVQKDLADLASIHPAVSHVLVMERQADHAGLPGLWKLVQEIRKETYDLAVVLPGSIRTALAIRLARIPRRIGWDPGSTLSGPMKQVRFPSAMCTLPFVRPIVRFETVYRKSRPFRFLLPRVFTDSLEFKIGEYAAERNLRALRHLGRQVPKSLTAPWLRIPDTVRASVSSWYVATDKGSVSLAPGAGQPTRRWPEENSISLARLLAADGYTVYILGGAGDKATCERISRSAASALVLSVAGDLTPIESMELIRRSRALVANDSAPVHMASAVGTPTVALFGPTLPEFGFAPLALGSEVMEKSGLPCRPCTVYGSGSCPVGTLACLTSISVETVYAAVMRAANSRPQSPTSAT